ncbi:MAG: hypothetical protein J7474_04205 [Arthrobacter sp.]|nr:hypothetical protein [Arthrobacter sp.]
MLLLLVTVLVGCAGDYSASGDCKHLANELSPVIEKSLGFTPSINKTWGDGGMTPWCRIDFSTTKENARNDDRLRSAVEEGIAGWPSGVVVTIHSAGSRTIEVRSPGKGR